MLCQTQFLDHSESRWVRGAELLLTRLKLYVILFRTGLHILVVVLLAVDGSWWLALLNLPIITYLVYEMWTVPRWSLGIYDPAEIHNRLSLRRHLQNCVCYMVFYLITFFVYFYWWEPDRQTWVNMLSDSVIVPSCSRMIIELLRGDPIRKHEDDEIITSMA